MSTPTHCTCGAPIDAHASRCESCGSTLPHHTQHDGREEPAEGESTGGSAALIEAAPMEAASKSALLGTARIRLPSIDANLPKRGARSARLEDPLQNTSLLEPVRSSGPATLVPGDIRVEDIRALAVGRQEQDADSQEFTSPATSSISLAPAIRRRRARWHRVVPLAVVLSLMFAGALLVTFRPSSPPRVALPSADASTTLEGTAMLAAGTFTLGLTEDNKEVVLALCHRLSDNPATECRRQYLTDRGEYPARAVQLPELHLDRFETSNAGWANCEAAGACPTRDIGNCAFYSVARGRELREGIPEGMLAPNMPAICATADEAEQFCQWLDMRLPTADEWERAARSGDDRLQPWGSFVMPGLLNWGERILGDFPIPGRVDGYELTAPVDEYRSGATDDGVHNLLGNVAEWVRVPAADATGVGRVGIRGGSYIDRVEDLRATHHTELRGDERRSTIGFRCVR